MLTRVLTQVWDGGSLVNTVSGNGEMHGAMYTGDVFSSLEWDAGDERLIYVAERKAKEASSFWQSVRKQGKCKSLLQLLRGRSRRRPLCGNLYGDMDGALDRCNSCKRICHSAPCLVSDALQFDVSTWIQNFRVAWPLRQANVYYHTWRF